MFAKKRRRRNNNNNNNNNKDSDYNNITGTYTVYFVTGPAETPDYEFRGILARFFLCLSISWFVFRIISHAKRGSAREHCRDTYLGEKMENNLSNIGTYLKCRSYI